MMAGDDGRLPGVAFRILGDRKLFFEEMPSGLVKQKGGVRCDPVALAATRDARLDDPASAHAVDYRVVGHRRLGVS